MNEKLNDMQNEVKDSAHKIWLAGLGALTLAGEEGTKMFKSLVEKGAEFESREKAPVEAIKNTYDRTKEAAGDLFARIEGNFNDKVASALQKLGVPTRDEIAQLTNRVDALMEAINKLNTKES